jgi:hypothetical protein
VWFLQNENVENEESKMESWEDFLERRTEELEEMDFGDYDAENDFDYSFPDSEY